MIEALVANRLTSPVPLVHVRSWARDWAVGEALGVEAELLNADRIGRALDAIAPHLDRIAGSVGVVLDPVPVRHPGAPVIIPATLVSAAMTSLSVTLLVDMLAHGPSDSADVRVPFWAGLFLGLLPFLAWGLFLGAATLGYHHRRRGRCTRCGGR